jgi:ribose 5-phosphate isomerase B
MKEGVKLKIIIASDHSSIEMKESVKNFLVNKNIEVIDIGTNDNRSVDYPDYAEKLGNMVISNKNSFGILICGTGIGMSIAVNKIKGIRGALCLFPDMARLARTHNNANVLVMGGRLMGVELANWTVETFLETKFEGGRHETRVNKISDLEE